MLDRRFLNISLTILNIANQPDDNPSNGIQYIVGSNPAGAFANASPNSIARYDGSAWKFTTPKAGELEVLNAATGEILRFNGSAWSAVSVINAASNAVATDIHTLTAQEVTAKSFTLANSVASGQENNILLFVSGVAQVAGVDFTASGNSISWNNKALDSLGLVAGDTFIIHYVKA